jgi:dUTP pyrophosphatase
MSAMNAVNKMQVRIMRLPHAADLAADNMPLSGHERTAGFDLLAAIPAGMPLTIESGRRAAIPTGLAFALPRGIEARITPVAALALRVGVIAVNLSFDADYRGEIHVILVNLGTDPVTLERGARIARLILSPTVQTTIHEVSSLDD